jgi:O-antigen/teichoic acid export membrane protein
MNGSDSLGPIKVAVDSVGLAWLHLRGVQPDRAAQSGVALPSRRRPRFARGVSGLRGFRPSNVVAASALKQVSAPAARAAGARLVTLPLSAGLALATSKIIIDTYGLAAYGVFALVLAIPALLPSRDLGLGAKLTDVVARRNLLGAGELEATLAAAVAKIAKVAGVAVVIVIGLQWSVGWHALLGASVHGVPDPAITGAVCLFILALPGGLSSSVLWGLRRNDLLAIQAPLLTLCTCLGVTATALLSFPLWVAIVLAMASNCVIQWATLYLVTDYLGISRRALVIQAMRPTPQSFRAWAIPMFVITTASAIGYQTDRLVLSHTRSALDVGQYSVAAQLFLPLWAIVSSAGYTLWGTYAVDRDAGGISRGGFRRTVAIFAAVGLAEGAFLTLVGPRAIRVLLGVDVPWGVCGAFALLLAFQAIGLPLGMLLTDQRGLRLQAALFSAMVILNVWLSIRWAHGMGAAGPVLASAASYCCVVLVPSAFFVRRYLSQNANAQSDGTSRE